MKGTHKFSLTVELTYDREDLEIDPYCRRAIAKAGSVEAFLERKTVEAIIHSEDLQMHVAWTDKEEPGIVVTGEG